MTIWDGCDGPDAISRRTACADLVSEIEGHLSEAIPLSASDHEALGVLERLGPPGDIVEAEQRVAQPQVDRRGLREWAAVILLPLGGFAFGVGWLVGLILLWSSRLWTTRDKLIGTLIIPGGIATRLFVFLVLSTALSLARVGPRTAAGWRHRSTPPPAQ